VGYNAKVVVVGAGLSGLACAYRLKHLGIRALVLEASERAGGVIATIRRDGFLFEGGPQCPRFPEPVWRLVKALNLESEFVAGDRKAKRYIFRNGRLHLAPFSPGGLISTRLVGAASKFRLLSEVFLSSHPPEREETLAEFVERKFGVEILENLVDPIVSTVFLGDCYKMGMESALPALVQWERKHGSLVRGAIQARTSKHNPRNSDHSFDRREGNANKKSLRVTDSLPSLGSFHSGMATLAERLAAELKAEICYRSDIVFVAPFRNENGTTISGWEIGVRGGEKIRAEKLVLAVPSYVAAEVLGSSAPELASRLKAIEYAPMCVVSCVYERSQVANPLDGFGYMVPRREGLATICTFWNSSLFPGRAPENKVLMTGFTRMNEAGDEQQLAAAVASENGKVLGITGEPLDRVVWWNPTALPQYNVDHSRRVSEIESILQASPNLYVTGNFLRGRSIGDCADVAFRVAEDLHSHLNREHI
jgi:protoporphyrinogen/coproporphyrinogen III oxidase